jgi:hypothetical protein
MKSLLKRGGLGLLLCYACAWSAETPSVNAQPRWGVAGQYLTLNGTPVFLTGANYIPSTGWLTILENWKPDAIDRDMAALHKLGVASIRFPPLWPLLQPTPDGVSAEKLSRVNQLVTIAYRNGISVQVGAITGWMSGATFLPKWADGNIFTDPAIVAAEQNLAGELARALKDNPGLQGYDFGNEINALASMMRLRPTADQAKQWMDTIYQAFRKVDPHHPGGRWSRRIWRRVGHLEYRRDLGLHGGSFLRVFQRHAEHRSLDRSADYLRHGLHNGLCAHDRQAGIGAGDRMLGRLGSSERHRQVPAAEPGEFVGARRRRVLLVGIA